MATAAGNMMSPACTQPRRLLSELREAHLALLQAMAELDDLTRGPVPAKERVIDARWNISRGSLARRTLWSRIHACLVIRVIGAAADDLRKLQEADITLLRASTAHVSAWRINDVMANWSGYREASAKIRWKMKAAISTEQRLLYPLLTAAASGRF